MASLTASVRSRSAAAAAANDDSESAISWTSVTVQPRRPIS